MLTPMGIEPWPLIASDSIVKYSPFYTNWAFACKTETVGSLYSHALLTPLKSSKFNCQVVHEQKFKDLLSSTVKLVQKGKCWT